MHHTCGALTKKETKCIRKVPFEDCKCFQHADKNEVVQCTICLEDINPTQRIKLKCHHTFHEKCIHRWLTKKHECPLCRHRVKDKKTLQWMDNYDETDEEWLPETEVDVPERRWRRLRRRVSARRTITLMDHLSALIDQISSM